MQENLTISLCRVIKVSPKTGSKDLPSPVANRLRSKHGPELYKCDCLGTEAQHEAINKTFLHRQTTISPAISQTVVSQFLFHTKHLAAVVSN